MRLGLGKSPDINKQVQSRHMNEKLDHDKETLTSMKDQIKSVQKVINSNFPYKSNLDKRRRNLNIRGMGDKLTEDNLKTIN